MNPLSPSSFPAIGWKHPAGQLLPTLAMQRPRAECGKASLFNQLDLFSGLLSANACSTCWFSLELDGVQKLLAEKLHFGKSSDLSRLYTGPFLKGMEKIGKR